MHSALGTLFLFRLRSKSSRLANMTAQPSQGHFIEVYHLPEVFSKNINVQQRVSDLLIALTECAEVNDFHGRIHVTLTGEREAPTAMNRKSISGSSPSDWYASEDQMSHGGSGSGGNWIQE